MVLIFLLNPGSPKTILEIGTKDRACVCLRHLLGVSARFGENYFMRRLFCLPKSSFGEHKARSDFQNRFIGSRRVQLKGRVCVCVCVRAIGSLPCLVDDSVAHHRRRLSAVILDKAQNSTKCAVYKVKLFWPMKDRQDDSTPVGDDMTGSG